ncbi:MAG: hypothetical protein ACREOG_13855 [Gemmatimonadaceae bacterium]
MRYRAAAFTALLLISPTLAHANRLKIPAFARKYGLSCVVCHAPVPRLTAAGEAFAANGFEFQVGEEPRDTVGTGDPLLRLQRTLQLAVRFDAYAQVLSNRKPGQASSDLQSPWVMKLLSGGQVAHKISYYTYFLLSERGEVAGLEDAYVQFTDLGGSGISVLVGQFQVSDPMFKREVRLPYEDYHAYRVRVGDARADLTYDRGVMAVFSPWSGADVAVEVVNGQGLRAATSDRQYDPDNGKNGLVRFSQEFGPVRVGAFGYAGSERANGVRNRTAMWGPDATLALGNAGELNVQYIRRTDDDPFYGSCTPSTPCPDGRIQPFETTVSSAFAEATFWPQGQAGRLFISALYNWLDADAPVVSLRLGEQNTPAGFLSRYQTGALGLHYVLRRNVRLMGEAGWDFERDQGRLIAGTMVAF